MTLTDQLRLHITRRHLHPPLGFVHIPKAGGTAMVRQLDARLRPRKFVYGLDRSQFGSFSAFETMTPSMRGGIFLEPNSIPADADIIAGHMSPALMLERFPKLHLVTVLRAPEARLLSHWVYWRGYSDEVLAEFGEWGHAIAGARCDLADFLQMPALACQTDNLILRMLLWPHPLIPHEDFIDPAHEKTLLAAARTALRRFTYVDVIEAPKREERLDEWLCATYGSSFWAKLRQAIPDTTSANRNEANAPALRFGTRLTNQLAGSAGRLLRERNRLDTILWADTVQVILPNSNPETLAADTLSRNASRYDRLDHSS